MEKKWHAEGETKKYTTWTYGDIESMEDFWAIKEGYDKIRPTK